MTQVYSKLEKGEYESVIKLLDQSKLKSKKFLSTKNYLKGISYARLQDFENSVDYFKRAVKTGNKTADIYYEVGQGLYALNELEQSRKAFYRSAKLNYQVSQSYYYIGHISQLLDEHKNAKNYFSKILKRKDASENLIQIARFQLSESLLHLARTKSDTKSYVKRYILPQLNKALEINKKSATGRDITRRIAEIKKEFGLDPNLLVNGRRIPDKKITATLSQAFAYDNNFTLSNDLPGNLQTKQDTFVFTTVANVDYTAVFKRRYLITTGLNLENESHGNRQTSDVYSSDSYTLTPSVETKFAHKLFNKPANLLFNLEYEYKAKDKNGIKEKSFNNRTISFDLGEKFRVIKYGDTTVKFGRDQFRSYDELLNFDKTSISIDQLVYYRGKMYLLYFQTDKSDYFNNIANSTKNTLIRFDYISPEILPKINLNLGLSRTWLSYEDVSKSVARGTETTTDVITKFTKTVSKIVSADFEYIYTKNSSELEDSSYTKHETKFQVNLNY